VQRKDVSGKPNPASFEKTIKVGDTPFTMQIDFLAGEYGGTAKSHRHHRTRLHIKGAALTLLLRTTTRKKCRGDFRTAQRFV